MLTYFPPFTTIISKAGAVRNIAMYDVYHYEGYMNM